MTRPDDSILDGHQIATVCRHADRLLRDAGALYRFPTPIDDLMEAAKLTVVENEVLNESTLRQFMRGAKSGIATIKSALSKVLGLFDPESRVIVLDSQVPVPRIPFIKLHEAGHGTLPHQNRVYRFIHDCIRTLDPDMSDLFEREANVFASEVLFQGEVFFNEARDQKFGIKVPMALAKKFGASNYSAFRRYVATNEQACCVVVLDKVIANESGGFSANVRRIVASKSFHTIYDSNILFVTISDTHAIASVVPNSGKRMSFAKEIVLIDRNGDERLCVGEAFDTTHQILILLRDLNRPISPGIVVPFISTFRLRTTA